ncbi:dienelactone hydrolase family protein [Bosea vaviloviae]|uniref:dienelactone hydrolase family protein n=1 Tax=Bosea vaviloviae TaxID=1526658 RepID=UPI0009F4BE58|nr:dienelactone hydrolase family protein [Bosea vaviloviae]
MSKRERKKWPGSESALRRDTGKIVTDDGELSFVAYGPDRAGNKPPILLYMDSVGIRPGLEEFSRRLARAGHWVILPDLYYRTGPIEIDARYPAKSSAEIQRHTSALTEGAILSDTQRILAAMTEFGGRAIGRWITMGFCMGGRFAVWAAGQYSGQVAACVSVIGTSLVRETGESPVDRLFSENIPSLFVFAGADEYIKPASVAAIEERVRRAKNGSQVKVCPSVGHGFIFPDRHNYDEAESEHAWEFIEEFLRGVH